MLRFGRFYESLQSALPVMSSVSDPVIRLICVLSRISNACFMLIDHMVCLEKLGVLSSTFINSAKWDRTSTRFWLYAITLGLARDFYEIRRIYKEEFHHSGGPAFRRHSHSKPDRARDRENDPETRKDSSLVELVEHLRLLRRVVKEHADVAVDTLKNLCDLFLPLNSLGFVKLSPGTVGLLGVVSTVASSLPMMNPMIKMVPAT